VEIEAIKAADKINELERYANSMKIRFFIIYLIGIGFHESFAQNQNDAIRYSQSGATGTALAQGMGGATGAVGGDFSNASNNPAGLGLFRSSELAITPNLFNYLSKSRFYGQKEDDGKFNFNISNMHMVLHFPSQNSMKTKGWLSTTFTVGFNRTSNLHQQITVRGINTDGSIVNAAAAAAQGTPYQNLNPFSTLLFWNAYLIDLNNQAAQPNSYFSKYGMTNGGATQRINLESSGRTGETDISFAGNYSNRLYVGGSLAFRRIVYEQTISHNERNETDSVPTFSSLNYRTNQTDRGSSVALRGGVIYRMNDWFRAGLAAIIPVDYTITRSYLSSIRSVTAEGNSESTSPDGSYTYQIRQTPRITASGAFIIKKRGIISLDYETVNYSRVRLRDDEGSFDQENENIRSNYRFTGNLRVGAEVRFVENYIRAGYQQLGSPKISEIRDSNTQIFSLGAGFRNENYYLDAAYLLSIQKGSFTPYDPSIAFTNLAELNISKHSLVITVGTRF
jgi:hypothetical protein